MKMKDNDDNYADHITVACGVGRNSLKENWKAFDNRGFPPVLETKKR